MISMRRLVAGPLLTSAGLLLAGCGPLPLVSGSFEATQVCKSLPDQYFQGAPMSMTATAGTSMQVDLGSELDPMRKQGVTLNVQLSSLTLTPKQGVSDFGFLESLRLSAPDTAGDTTLADYQKDPQAPSPKELLLRSDAPVNLAEVAQQGQVQVDLTASGQMPTSDWSVDAVACFHVSGTVDR